MADVLDLIPTFETFARKAALENPIVREQLWRELYQRAHSEVFSAFLQAHGSPEGHQAVVRELSRVKTRATEAHEPVIQAIQELDPYVAHTLGIEGDASPLHVVMVGTFSVNAAVGRLDDRVVVFHCLEWFQSPIGARILVAHEGTHAWHEIGLGQASPEDDLAWMAFYEGIAVRNSRELVPERPDDEYFWYGHEGFEDWLPWCREHHDELLHRFRDSLDDPEAPEAFFGGGFIEDKWRTGFYIADHLVGQIGLTLPKLAAMSITDGADIIREALKS